MDSALYAISDTHEEDMNRIVCTVMQFLQEDSVINLYTIEQAEEWDEIVRSFLRYDVYWLSGYVKAFHYHGDGDPLLFHYERDGTRGINVVEK